MTPLHRRDFLKSSAAGLALAGTTFGFANGAKSATPGDAAALNANEAVAAIRRGDMTAEDYAKALLARAQQLNQLNAYITLNADGMLAAARKLDLAHRSGQKLGQLAGLPLLVKDNIDTAALPTTAGTKGLADNRPTRDAPVLRPLFAAGALLMAKMNMHELAFGITSTNAAYGAVKNPYDPRMIPGGSSGGTAAAIAAHLSPVGLGSDTGGSMRIPAALCGVCGLRPSVDDGKKRYPAARVVPISHTRDTVGPMGRRMADLALIDAVITGQHQPAPARLKGVRIGVPRSFFWDNLDPELATVMEAALTNLRKAGVEFIEADLPGIGDLNGKLSFPIALYEVGPDLKAYLAREGGKISFDEVVAKITSKDVAGAFGATKTITKEVYDAALHTYRPQLQRLHADYFAQHKVAAIVFPTTPLPARPINTSGDTGQDTVELNGKQVPTFPTYIRNTDPGSNAGIPGLSVPAGLTKSGLPVGLELDGPVGSDRTLIALGMGIERVLGPPPPPHV